MHKLAMILIFLLIFPTVAPAKNWQEQATRASECPGLARACTGAARELIAARDLITGLQEQIAAHEESAKIAEQQIETLKRIGALSTERAKELESVIAAEKESVALLLRRKELQEKRIVQLEKQLGRARKLTLFLGAAATVGIVIAVGK